MTILVTGPESSGKTTLARQLAWALDGRFVAEASRNYLEQHGSNYVEADLPKIWFQQAKAEDTARASSASFIVCDTGPEVIRVWAEVKYGRCPPAVLKAFADRTYDLTFLCAPDIPWAPDPFREAPDSGQRAALFARYRELLPEAVVIRGDNRLEQALRVIFSLTSSPL